MYVEKIREIYPHLSPGFTRVADFLIDHYTEAAFMTATELAHRLEVDAATIVRFAQRLGYLGFPQLQHEIREIVKADLLALRRPQPKTQEPQDVMIAALEQVENNIQRLRYSLEPETVRTLIGWFTSGKPVHIVAYSPMVSMARLLRDFLSLCDLPVHMTDGDLLHLSRWATTVHAGDTVMAIEIASMLPFAERALALARERKAHTVALVTQASMPTTRHADLVFVAPGDSLSPNPSHAAIGAFVSALAQALPSALKLDLPGQRERAREALEFLLTYSNGSTTLKEPAPAA